MPSPASPASTANPVDAALITRRSVRAFLPTPMPRADIEAILEVASRAPSGTNTQPWKVYVLTGNSLARFFD
jgi:nitroreductase